MEITPLFPILGALACVTAKAAFIATKKILWQGKYIVMKANDVENSQAKRVMKAIGGYAVQILAGILGVASSLALSTTAGVAGIAIAVLLCPSGDPRIFWLPPVLALGPLIGLICAVAMSIFCFISLVKICKEKPSTI